MNDFNETDQRGRTAPGENDIPSPWGIALREARVLILFVALIATTYMVFAVDAPKLAYERPVRHIDSGMQTPPIAGVDTMPSRPIDTIPGDTITRPVDTSSSKPTVIDSGTVTPPKTNPDSVAQAEREKQRIRDSVARAMNLQAERGKIEKLFTDNAEINTDVARKIVDMKLGAVWLDARPEHEFEEGHIAGARNFYAEQWRSHIPELMPLIREKIVVYCGGGECDLSHELANGLRSIGFKTVVVYTGGTTDWVAKGNKLVK